MTAILVSSVLPFDGPPPLWPHQIRGLDGLYHAWHVDGVKSVCVTGPTASGKTRLLAEIALRESEEGRRLGIFTHRKLLTGQTSGCLDDMGLEFGVMAAGHGTNLHRLVQVVSLPTLDRRVGTGVWDYPEFDTVLLDEAHLLKGSMAQRVHAHYLGQRAKLAGFTATPVGLKGLYDRLVVAGTVSECRKAGALVPCLVFAPDEPDLQGVKRVATGEYVHKEATKRMMSTLIFGNVFDHWRRHNPEGKPTLLFAPGVPESMWFVKQWEEMGVRAAHMDGDTDEDERKRIIEAHKAGEIKIICSCGVLREGINFPWVFCGILCQACGALSTFLQLSGRLLRSHPGKDHAILIDHSGAIWRHGSPNIDRDWSLSDTDLKLAKKRKQKLQRGEESEGIRCPKCSGVRKSGPTCPFCGHGSQRNVRIVRMTDGTLQRVVGAVVKRKPEQSPDQKLWVGILCRMARAGRSMTLAQARGLFAREVGRELPRGLLHCPPADSVDWSRAVATVYPWTAGKKQAKS